MRPVQHPKGSVGLDGAGRSWITAFAEEVQAFLGRRAPTTTREAARVLGHAAAAKRQRDNRTYEERKADFHARLRAERDGGWPIDPARLRKG